MQKNIQNGSEWIGLYPCGWKIQPIRYLITNHFSGSWGNDAKGDSNDRICMRIADFEFEKMQFKNLDKESYTVRNYNYTDIYNKTLRYGDVLIEKSGGGEKTPVGRTVIYRLEYPALCANFMDCIRINTNIINVEYIKYVFYALYKRGTTNLYFNQTTGLQNLNMSKYFREVKIPIPPKHVQKKIADYLDTKCKEIDSLVSDIQTEIDILEQYKKTVITEAVTRGVNRKTPMIKTGYTFIPYVPEHWEFTKAGRLFVEDVRSAAGNEQPLSLSQKDGLIKTEDMVEHAMKSKTYAGWKKVRRGDLVLNRFKAHLGVFFSSKYDGMVSFHYGVYVPKVDLNIKFYEYLFHAKPYCDMYAELSNGITVGLQNLSNANFYAGKCVYPPKEEQDEIVKFLDDKCGRINETISLKREQLLTLEELKKSVIYEYVTGKKEVPQS